MKKADFYRNARTDISGPLSGVRVLEATTTWAGPMCAAVLAGFGADVIKVERAGQGDLSRYLYLTDTPVQGESTIFHAINQLVERDHE